MPLSAVPRSFILLLVFNACLGLFSNVSKVAAARENSLEASDPDWVKVLKLSLANLALSRANTKPEGFKCSSKGTDNKNCNCWNDHGDPQEWKDLCHEPKECLMYNEDDSGYFNFTQLPEGNDTLHQTLSEWGVPEDMVKDFDAAALVQSADFSSFHFEVKEGDKGHFDAHVGSLRNYNGSIYVGYVSGTTDGDLVQIYERHQKVNKRQQKALDWVDGVGNASVVVCQFFDMKKKGYSDEQIAELNNGLQAYAYTKAADMVPQ